MKKILFILSIIVLTLVQTNCPAFADSQNKEIDKILNSAETFFISMKNKDYKRIWEGLSLRSKKTIVNDVNRAMAKSGQTDSTADNIYNDFEGGSQIARSYWNAYLGSFDPDIVLNESKWEIGAIEKERAVINLTYKKSGKPAILQMFKEESNWKVGLVETFWPRK